MTADIKELTKKRGHIKARLTKFSGFLRELSDQTLCAARVTELQLRIEKLESLYNTYDEIQTKLEYMTDDDQLQLDERSEFEDLYYNTVAAAKELVRLHTKHDGGDVWSENSGQRHSRVKCKLPTISLPKFDGSYDTWLEFHDTFDSLIHRDESIEDVNKFHYLRASLQGSAALIIQSLALSSSNYQVAWQLICDRYNNKRLLVNNHVTAIFNINPITRESPLAIRYLIDTLCKNIRALATLNEPTSYWDTLLVHITCQKLDNVTRREWEQHIPSCESVTFEALINFLRDRADLLETMAMGVPDRRASWPAGPGASAGNAAHSRSVARRAKEKCFVGLDAHENSTVSSPLFTPECPLCKRGHWLFECPDFLALSNNKRADKVKGMKVCLNCLKPGHIAKYCRRGPCKSCSARHNSLLHVDRLSSETQVAVPVIEAAVSEQEEPTAGPSFSANSGITLPAHPVVQGQVLLSTALVQIYGRDNTVHTARALLDNGSTSSFMSESLWRKLNLPARDISASVSGITNVNSKLTKICQAKVRSLLDKNYSVHTSYFILPEITSNLPMREVNHTMLDIPQHIVLADPKFYVPAAIDLLLGADVFWDLLGSGRLTLGRNKPTIYETKLGWVVSGTYVSNPNPQTVRCNFVQLNNIDDELTRFWKLDEATIKPASAYYSEEENACEEHFVQNTTRLPDGRFMVRVPLKQPPTSLGDSYDRAKQCFLSLERKLERQPMIKQMYQNFMDEYETLGDMTKVTSNVADGNFLPHHGVLRLSSLTTKLRVVFNASARTATGVSFNDIQLVGPTIQDDLVAILLRFRQYRFVYTADVEKMYRRIVVHPDDRRLQQIIWRKDPSEPLYTYKLNTVTYGTASAPFLAVRCLKQLALECADPQLSDIISSDFYMDDYLSGSNAENEAKDIISRVTSILQGAGMNLRKWRSNEPLLIPEPCEEARDLNLGNLDDSKTLGLGWKSSSDELYYKIDLESTRNQKLTKRLILSTVAKIFDPLGLVSPVIIQCKILLQQLWLSKLSWDDEIPQDIAQKWDLIIKSLPGLNELRIPRCVIGNDASRIEFHIFTDASQTAYGACLYVRTITHQGIITKLLMAKSRVAPIKPVTIPRLELCGALIGAQLYKKALTSLRLTADTCIFWTDSMIVLGWLRMLPSQLKVFVRNRVADILEITGSWPWRHVPTKENPADLVSRGLSANMITTADLWFTGPPFLQNEEKQWPPNCFSKENSPELNAEVGMNVAVKQFVPPLSELKLNQFSSFTKLKRVTAYVLRFINNCRSNTPKLTGIISIQELKAATSILIKLAQIESFQSYDSIKNKVPLAPKDPLTKLNVFIDQEGLIRVGGRLNNSPYNLDVKHPVILPNKHFLTRLYFDFVHLYLLHGLPQAMLLYVKSKYWPIGGREQARSTYRKCVLCTRMRGATVAPLMGSLPSARVTPGFPFATVGVDYAGPLIAASRKGRGSHCVKVYIVIFVCFKTKCIHLELISDLSSEGYMATLRRFVSRRGFPSDIYSDNGTQFVGAFNELKRFLATYAREISELAANEDISFHFVPPYSPHFGGLWEAGVKSTKHHLVRVVGNSHLTYEEIYSTLCQIEAILNSRPLTPLTNDPSDLLPLTPGHFLIGRPLTALPTPCLKDASSTRLTRYQRIEQLRQHFWNRWHKEYVSELQERSKWRQSKGQLATDTMVVINDDNLPPLKWKLGRIVAVIPGADGISRVADIRTASGIIRRSFSKICPLPVEI